MTRKEAKTIATDPKVIPMGSKVLLIFNDEKHKKYSGIYVARDTGGAIKGNKIDLFMGDFYSDSPNDTTIDFGRTEAKVYIIK